MVEECDRRAHKFWVRLKMQRYTNRTAASRNEQEDDVRTRALMKADHRRETLPAELSRRHADFDPDSNPASSRKTCARRSVVPAREAACTEESGETVAYTQNHSP